MITFDPGVKGGFAWKCDGEVFTAPIPPFPKDAKETGINWSNFQLASISRLVAYIKLYGESNMVYSEHVGPRPSDTPKTAYRLSANYHTCLAVLKSYAIEVKQFQPRYWQNQLPFLVPSGDHNYTLRKKMFHDFAKEKYPKVKQVGFNKKGTVKIKECAPIKAVADAVCMLWVFSGDV